MRYKIIASIQARLGSTRLPGKVLKLINGKPMLYWHINRLKKSRLIDDVIIATTTNPKDDKIVSFCESYGVSYYRGSEDDVLDRISSMIKKFNIDVHIELFGDSPLTDAHIVDEFIGYLLKNYDDVDFVSNSIETTYPPGQEVLVYKGQSLIEANNYISKKDPSREHVSIHIYKYPNKYKIVSLQAPNIYNYPEYYMEVDTVEDFYVVNTIFKHFFNLGQEYFTLSQILDYLNKNPELSEKNRFVKRRWKQFRNDGK